MKKLLIITCFLISDIIGFGQTVGTEAKAAYPVAEEVSGNKIVTPTCILSTKVISVQIADISYMLSLFGQDIHNSIQEFK
jgi:hypothetical protein